MARTSLIPGFRFHPTDVELVMYYLKKRLLGKKITVNVVAEVNIYDFCPWDLPDKSCLKNGDLEWYFFCPKSKKYSSGGRCNRATETGFWKATGKDRIVKYKERTVATIKTLVFHLGHAGKGDRTDWVMHEYRMEDQQLAIAGILQDAYVLCKIFEKSGAGPKNGAQYGAPFNEDEWDEDLASSQPIVGASNTKDHKQKGSVTMSLTEPGSSAVTFSTNMTEPGSSNTPATSNMTGPGSSVVSSYANTLNHKQKGPANMNLTTSETESTVTLSTNEMPANDDVMFLKDLDQNMGDANGENVKTIASNEDDGIYDDLINLVNLDDFKTGVAEYTLDEPLIPDPDLGSFYVEYPCDE